MNKYQIFALPDFCGTNAASAMAGKDILLKIYGWDESLLAIAGQQSLTINRSADSIEVSSKDTQGGWKAYMSGMKEWSIETEGLYVADDKSMQVLSKAFLDSDPVCIVIENTKLGVSMFGGSAYITDFPLEAPHDDAMTYSITLSGNGELIDLSSVYVNPSDFVVNIPSMGSATRTATVLGYKGSVTASSDTTGVTASVSGDVVTITITSTADAGIAKVTLTDTYTGGTDECEITITLEPVTV